MGFIFSSIYYKFFSKKLEICLLGLEFCGKTTFVNNLLGEATKKTFPTIGLNVKTVQKGSIKKSLNRRFNENMGYWWTISVSSELGGLCKYC